MRIEDIVEEQNVYSPRKFLAHIEDILKLRKEEIIVPSDILLHVEKFCPHDCFFCAYRASGWPQMLGNFLTPDWVEKADERQGGQLRKPRGKRKPGISGLPKELGLSIPKQMAEAKVPAVELTGSGEPTVWPWIDELLHEFKKYERKVALVTNGQYIGELMKRECFDPDTFAWLRFSMDSAKPETHQAVHGYRGKNQFDDIIRSIRMARKKYPRTLIGISYIINPLNFREVVAATILYKELGLNNIRFSFEYSPEHGQRGMTPDMIAEAESLVKEAKGLDNTRFRVFTRGPKWQKEFNSPNTDFVYCGVLQFSWNIGADGFVYPCCIEIYNPRQRIGNLREKSIKEIIESPEYIKFIEKFNVQSCNPCWMREKNKGYEEALAPEKKLGHTDYQ